MNPDPSRRTLVLAGAFTLATVLSACGGTAPEATAGDGRARPLAAAPSVIPPLLDDDGHLNPAPPSARPADTGAHTRHGHYATAAQAAQLEQALGDRVISVEVSPGPDAAAAVELAAQMADGQQAVHDLPADTPVLVRSSDLRLGAAAVHQLEAAGYTRVVLVNP
ncbi:MAG: hypothetical protein O9343_15480 [Burkholderiaceae bacterium]|jgi:hypothetical protein|nr:hypothetical protein [Burkholderiaceae bacterium]MCZ8176590.1 hypothetical protein [Burkholderiaceae bacterium]